MVIAILDAPHRPSEAGDDSFSLAVLEGGLMVAILHLEGVGGEAHVADLGLALLLLICGNLRIEKFAKAGILRT